MLGLLTRTFWLKKCFLNSHYLCLFGVWVSVTASGKTACAGHPGSCPHHVCSGQGVLYPFINQRVGLMHDCSSHCSWLEETWAFLATSFPFLYTRMAANHPLTGLKPFPIFTYSFHPLVEFWKMWFGSLQSCRHLRWGAVACKLAAIFRKEKELMWKWLHTPNGGIQSNSVYAFAEIKITLRAGH